MVGPIITLLGDNPHFHELGTVYTDMGVTVHPTNANVTFISTLDVNQVGEYSIEYRAEDSYGYVTTVTRYIIVGDTTPPVITLLGNNPVVVVNGNNYVEDGASSDGGEQVSITGTVDTNKTGKYVLKYTSVDGVGNTAHVSRTVHVVNPDGPILTLLGSNPYKVELNTNYIEPGVTSDGEETVTISNNTVQMNNPGTYVITYISTDAAGKSGTITRNVHVVDTIAPIITLLGKNPVIIEKGTDYIDAGAISNGGEDVISSGFVNTNIVGRYIITYTSEDSYGNKTTAIRTVFVDILPTNYEFNIDFGPLLQPNPNPYNIVSNKIIGSDGSSYYRDYSFLGVPFDYDSLRLQQLNIRNDLLEYNNKEQTSTKSQIYANKVRGKWMHRTTTFASKGTSNNITNPNTKNYLRVDSNNNILNQPYKDVIPNTVTNIPYMNQLNKETVYTSDDIVDISYVSTKVDKTEIVLPIVNNDTEPVKDEIVKGGILYAGTRFNKASDREKFDKSLYKFSEQAIVSSEFANKFNINVEATYDKEEVEKITGKTFLDLYPDYPSWAKKDFHGSVMFSSTDGKDGDFLPSMYNSGYYVYNHTTSSYDKYVAKINLFVPPSDPLANGNNVTENVKVHTFDF